MLKTMLERVRERKPLVHNIMNRVSINDCANLLLAIGASPIMADDAEEASEIVSQCQGLVLNLGMPSRARAEAMRQAGRTANAIGIPIVFDPVGVGASAFRRELAAALLEEVHPTVIRGNLSEIRTLMQGFAKSRGVDVQNGDCICEDNFLELAEKLKAFAKDMQSVIAVTSVIDLVTDGTNVYAIRNGHPMMRAVTGSGCQLSALVGAFVAANPKDVLEATAAAFCAMGIAGEVAHGRLSELDGNATYRNYMIDAVYRMTAEQLERGADYEVR